MTSEEHGAYVNIELKGELRDRVEMVMQAWSWSRAKAALEMLRKAASLPTPLDSPPDARLDGEGN
jgi:hypothetical protein